MVTELVEVTDCTFDKLRHRQFKFTATKKEKI